MFSFLTEKKQSGSGLECNLTKRIAEIEYHVTSLGVLLRCVRYGIADCLAYHRMSSGCCSGRALLYLRLGLIKSRYASDICQLICKMVMDLVLPLFAIGR